MRDDARDGSMSRRWAIGGIAVSLVMLVAASLPYPAGEIETVASQFEPTGFMLEEDPIVEPRRLVCLGDNPCPFVSRAWRFEKPFTSEALAGWLQAAGFDAPISGDCSTGDCFAQGTADGFRVNVWVASRPTADAPVSLRVSLSPMQS